MEAVSQYLTVKELADKLNICKASVYNYIKKPDFPQPYKLGRLTRFKSDEIDAYMANVPRGVYGEGK